VSNSKGFSLIEILVVLVIMGLLISVVAPTVLNSADDARIQKAQADFKSIETALKIYRLDNFVYPEYRAGSGGIGESEYARSGTAQLQTRRLPVRITTRPLGTSLLIPLPRGISRN
jgi:type II secretion system protein G